MRPKKTIPINFNNAKPACKVNDIFFLLSFLLITILPLIIVGIYCYYYGIEHRLK